MNCSFCQTLNTPYSVKCRSCEELMPLRSLDPMDRLCLQMLQLGAFADGTQKMTGDEIKSLLVPFFGQERIDSILHNSQSHNEPTEHKNT